MLCSFKYRKIYDWRGSKGRERSTAKSNVVQYSVNNDLLKKKVSVINAEGPPVPIPNTEVKLCSGDNTLRETVREDSSVLTSTKETSFPSSNLNRWRKLQPLWGCSSAGRAPALQAGGHGFESHHLHQASWRLAIENGKLKMENEKTFSFQLSVFALKCEETPQRLIAQQVRARAW